MEVDGVKGDICCQLPSDVLQHNGADEIYSNECQNLQCIAVVRSNADPIVCSECINNPVSLLISLILSPLTGRPGDPVIIGTPEKAVAPFTKLTLKCQSLGTAEATRLIWFRNGRELDSSYYTKDGYTINEFEMVARLGESAPLECRLEYPPLNIRQPAYADIVVLGQLYSLISKSNLCQGDDRHYYILVKLQYSFNFLLLKDQFQ